MTCLASRLLHYYWVDTGIPHFLPRLLLKHDWTVGDLKNVPFEMIASAVLTPAQMAFLARGPREARPDIADLITLVTILFQTGYLTLVRAADTGAYVTGFPNLEVAASLARDLLSLVTHNAQFSFHCMTDICTAVETCDPDGMRTACNTLLSQFTYLELTARESYYQSLLHLALLPMEHRASVQAEVLLHKGRPDLVVDLKQKTVIMELKTDQARESPLAQEYHLPCWHRGKEVHVWGISINTRGKESPAVMPIETRVFPAS